MTPLELLQMPPEMVIDFKYLLRVLGRKRRAARVFAAARAGGKR